LKILYIGVRIIFRVHILFQILQTGLRNKSRENNAHL